MKRITSSQLENAHEYMKQWIDSESWSDLSVALEHEGDTLYAADLLVNAGAIGSENLKRSESMCADAYECERTIEELARRFRKGTQRQQLNHVKRTFKDCFISECHDCNHVSFVADQNEDLYPELKTECWECGSTNIETKRGI